MQSINHFVQCHDSISTAIDAMSAQKKENLAKHLMEYVVFGAHVSTKYKPTIDLVKCIDLCHSYKQCMMIISALITLSQV